MTYATCITSPIVLITIIVLIPIIQFFGLLIIKHSIENTFKKHHAIFIENLKWEVKVREQAVRIAEYLSLAYDLRSDDPREHYWKINQLACELALWLPDDIYKSLGIALTNPSHTHNYHAVIIAVRNSLLRDKAGNLTIDDVIFHAPNAGVHNQKNIK